MFAIQARDIFTPRIHHHANTPADASIPMNRPTLLIAPCWKIG
jgi:hypothetical protein